MFDVPFFSSFKIFDFRADGVNYVSSKHILVKGLIVMVMTIESLLAHQLGPGVTKTKKPKENTVDTSKGPFKSPLTRSRDQGPNEAANDDGIGLFNKAKES